MTTTVKLNEQQVGALLRQAIEKHYGVTVKDMAFSLRSEAIMVPTHLAVTFTYEGEDNNPF